MQYRYFISFHFTGISRSAVGHRSGVAISLRRTISRPDDLHLNFSGSAGPASCRYFNFNFNSIFFNVRHANGCAGSAGSASCRYINSRPPQKKPQKSSISKEAKTADQDHEPSTTTPFGDGASIARWEKIPPTQSLYLTNSFFNFQRWSVAFPTFSRWAV